MNKRPSRWTVTFSFLSLMVIAILFCIRSVLDGTILYTIISGIFLATLGVIITFLQWFHPQALNGKKITIGDKCLLIGLILLPLLIGSNMFIYHPSNSILPSPSSDFEKDLMKASPDIVDPLIDGSSQTQIIDKWDERVTGEGYCVLDKDGYHVLSPSWKVCIMQANQNISNFALSVTVLIKKGGRANITFRQSLSGNTSHYTFFVKSDGSFGLYAAIGTPPDSVPLISDTFTPGMKHGLYTSNLISLKVVGSKIQSYINGQKVASVEDTRYHQGFIGLGVSNEKSSLSWVVFSNFKMWIYD